MVAILAADVAGYSRLMSHDEAGTLSELKAHRSELVDPKVAEHRGRIVKTTGDGILIEFPSVVEAVACAVAVQRGMGERNARVPEERRIVFRIGINLGDVIVENGDINTMASMSPHGLKAWLMPAEYVYPPLFGIRFLIGSIVRSRTSVIGASRTLLDPFGSTG